jgi:hypothetical protein
MALIRPCGNYRIIRSLKLITKPSHCMIAKIIIVWIMQRTPKIKVEGKKIRKRKKHKNIYTSCK